MSEQNDPCNHCGAPRAPGLAACKYCKTPYAFVRNTQEDAIPCPRCSTLNEIGAQKCAQCQAWVVVQCVFCGHLSPHNRPACLRCNEPFAGAIERAQQRQSDQRFQQGMEIAGTVGSVAASFLGAVVGAGVSGHHSHHQHHDGGRSARRHDDGGGFFEQVFSGDGATDVSESGGDGGGLFDALSSDSDSSSSDDAGGDGGGLLDSLLSDD